MTRLLAVIMTLILASATGLGGAGSLPTTLNIHDFAYDPAEITVPRGTILVWINQDDMPHTITEDTATKTFASDALDTDETFFHRFDVTGRFSYFCSLHPRMQGVVLVR